MQAEVSLGKKRIGDTIALESFVLLLLSVVGAAARSVVLDSQSVPRFDPWRHLLLVENLRAGHGFTLFASQPYIWYPPFWHGFAALMPKTLGLDGLSAIFSLLTIPLVYAFARLGTKMGSTGAGVAALFFALSGPFVAFTSYYGPESFALFLTLAALWLVARTDCPPLIAVAGAMLSAGLLLRINMAILGFLFIPFVLKKLKWTWLGIGGVLPLAWIAAANNRVLASNPFVFTWDGLAIPSSSYGWISTVFPQMHPAVQAALRTLHSVIMPAPEWFKQAGVIRWDTVLFIAFGLAAVLLSRRVLWIVAALLGLTYTLLLDGSHSTYFFRYSLGLFPLFFLSFGALADRVKAMKETRFRWYYGGFVAFALLAGARLLIPPPMPELSRMVPPPEVLTDAAYMVNSGYYHPECLMARYPEKRFIGLPARAEDLDAFLKAYPGYPAVVWHQEFSVQDAVLEAMLGSGRWRVAARWTSDYGVHFLVLKPT